MTVRRGPAPHHRLGSDEHATRVVLDQVMAGDPLAGAAVARSLDARLARPLEAFCLAMAQHWHEARDAAERALARSTDPTETWLARSVAAFASAGWPVRPADDAVDHVAVGAAEVDGLIDLDPVPRALAAHLLVEGALAQNRLGLAGELAARLGPPPVDFLADGDGAHAYVSLMHATHVRVILFRGAVTEAVAYLAGLPPTGAPAGRLLLEACTGILQASAGEPGVRALAERLEARAEPPTNHVASGTYLLVAYGLLALGDVARASGLVLVAGGGSGLERLTIIDRALGLELLVSAALADGDLDAAEAWAGRVAELRDSPVADSVAARTQARVEQAAGRFEEAAVWAQLAVDRARAADRAIEVAQGELLLSAIAVDQARPGEAQRRLEALVSDTDAAGYASARKAANRELRRAGRRLAPPRGGGWDVLSQREQSVGLLMARGFGNAEIAARLQVSEHTIRVHASRVLAAYAVASRTQLALEMANRLPLVSEGRLPTLTRRQRQVAELVTLGRRNSEIATILGIREGTVEQHVGNILRKWRLGSRTELAAVLASARSPRP